MQQQFQIDESQNKKVLIHSANYTMLYDNNSNYSVSCFVSTLKLGCDLLHRRSVKQKIDTNLKA